MGGSAQSGDDRLPWLDSPSPAARPTPAARRARTPLLVLLGLFIAGAIAMMAFLAGRSTAPVASPPTPRETVSQDRSPAPIAPAPVPARAPVLPAPAPVLPAPVVPSAPVAATPAPPVAARITGKAGKARTTRTKAKRNASARRAIERRSVARSRGVTVHRNIPRARTVPRRYRWPAHSAAAPSGRVVQLGAYRTGRQTNAAWLRLRRAYPYLRTLPRKVTVVAPRPGRPRYYRLRVGTRSAPEARALCDTMHRIGRGCIVV